MLPDTSKNKELNRCEVILTKLNYKNEIFFIDGAQNVSKSLEVVLDA